MMAHLFPFTDQPAADPDTGAKDALHARLDARGSRLRVFYTNTSAEYHRGDASLIHTDPDGTRDAAHGPYTRVYHFAGTEHGLGIWPPTDTQTRARRSDRRRSSARRIFAAWSTTRRCCAPASCTSTAGWSRASSRRRAVTRASADGTAVPPDRLAAGLRAHPRRALPAPQPAAAPARLERRCRPRRAAPSARSSPRWTPTATRSAASSCPSSRCRSPRTPAGTCGIPTSAAPSSSWSSRARPSRSPRTRAEREATGDPRPSIAERYASREDYLDRVRAGGATRWPGRATCSRTTSRSRWPRPRAAGTTSPADRSETSHVRSPAQGRHRAGSFHEARRGAWTWRCEKGAIARIAPDIAETEAARTIDVRGQDRHARADRPARPRVRGRQPHRRESRTWAASTRASPPSWTRAARGRPPSAGFPRHILPQLPHRDDPVPAHLPDRARHDARHHRGEQHQPRRHPARWSTSTRG